MFVARSIPAEMWKLKMFMFCYLNSTSFCGWWNWHFCIKKSYINTQQYIQRAVTCFNFLTFELLLTVYMVSYTDWLRTVVIVFVIVNYTPPSIFKMSSSRKWDSTVTFYRLLSQLCLQVIISLLRCSCRLTLSFETARHITKYNHK
jgi:hypothetical protein